MVMGRKAIITTRHLIALASAKGGIVVSREEDGEVFVTKDGREAFLPPVDITLNSFEAIRLAKALGVEMESIDLKQTGRGKD